MKCRSFPSLALLTNYSPFKRGSCTRENCSPIVLDEADSVDQSFIVHVTLNGLSRGAAAAPGGLPGVGIIFLLRAGSYLVQDAQDSDFAGIWPLRILDSCAWSRSS